MNAAFAPTVPNLTAGGCVRAPRGHRPAGCSPQRSRQVFGTTPKRFLNSRLKCELLLKPHENAIAVTELFVLAGAFKSAAAPISRRSITQFLAVVPSS